MTEPRFHPESIAGIVLDAARAHAPPRRASARAGVFAADSTAGIILGAVQEQSVRALVLALMPAAVMQGTVGMIALGWGPDGEAAAPIEARPPLQVEHVVDLAPPPSPPSPSPVEEAPAPRAPEQRLRAPARAAAARGPEAPAAPKAPAQAAPPAQAGQVVLAESAGAPLDFTGFDMPVGGGERYAGGVTASAGTSAQAVHASRVDRSAPPGRPQGRPSRARPVGQPVREWRCPWPREADALSVDEQTVVIRTVVRADGTVASAELLSDPGYGFGQMSLACARKQRFVPAADDEGQPITATSPPIHVLFTRHPRATREP
ncbi:energy transducer TonB [Sorangium sp. So ce834]|uniref:energy transducer TonB n=1 Tax=Sorangium sp. So ce834 TaxID=3133321 RepID=UPI003F628E0A